MRSYRLWAFGLINVNLSMTFLCQMGFECWIQFLLNAMSKFFLHIIINHGKMDRNASHRFKTGICIICTVAIYNRFLCPLSFAQHYECITVGVVTFSFHRTKVCCYPIQQTVFDYSRKVEKQFCLKSKQLPIPIPTKSNSNWPNINTKNVFWPQID